MIQPIYEYGGAGTVIHMALANGFPPQTYKPLLDPLTAHYRVVSLPPRALWPGIGAPPEQVGTWRELADDLVAGIRHYGLKDVIAIGHSFGGIASLLAVLQAPELFRGLCLLDPTILAPQMMDAVKALRQQGKPPRIPLVDGALNRRSQFASHEEAFAYWRGKPLFQDWSDEALWLYTDSMTRPAETGFQLTWPPVWEAYYYMSLYPYIWDDLPRLNGLLPVLVVQGEKTDAFAAELAEKVREILPGAAHVTLPRYGHLFPQAAPDATRRVIEDWLKTKKL
jgi:pimeloyl-ACP methyl ester carboxylesterase